MKQPFQSSIGRSTKLTRSICRWWGLSWRSWSSSTMTRDFGPGLLSRIPGKSISLQGISSMWWFCRLWDSFQDQSQCVSDQHLVYICRHFEQVLDENKELVEHGLVQIQHIYWIEHYCDKVWKEKGETPGTGQIHHGSHEGVDGNGRYQVHLQLSRGKAITYACTRIKCLEDGYLLWDNNLAKKYYLVDYSGMGKLLLLWNHEAEANMPAICSLLATCKVYDVP